MTETATKRRPRICLAASGGGHLRQLLDLEPVWSRYDHFFVTEPSAIGDDLKANHRLFEVSHYAAGQAQIGKGAAMLRGAFSNLVQSLCIVWKERPDIVISTGAGAMFWVVLFSRIFGAKFILIESFARFDAPSKFARLSRPLANHTIVQSAALKRRWPHALLFDPLKLVKGKRPQKQPLTLATVGATLPFDRMSESVLALHKSGGLKGDLILQTGIGSSVKPVSKSGLRIVGTLPFAEMQMILTQAERVICHGGTGSFITALRQGCRVIAMPRLFERGEHYDNHQFEISTAFAERGLVEVALEALDLSAAVARADAKEPQMATTDPAALIAWLETKLAAYA